MCVSFLSQQIKTFLGSHEAIKSTKGGRDFALLIHTDNPGHPLRAWLVQGAQSRLLEKNERF